VLLAGAGSFEAAHVTMTQGVHLGMGADVDSRLAAVLDTVTDREGERVPVSGHEQRQHEVGKAMAANRG
jgi:hypothetical protein